MLSRPFEASPVACYRYYNIVLGEEGAANIKSQEFLHLIVSMHFSNQNACLRIAA